MTVGLDLGALSLVDPTGSPFAVETLAEGTDWGNPQPVEVVIRSLLQGGSLVAHERDENREVMLRVIITAADSAALAQGEAALMAELYRANTLTYTPADGWGPPTVFDVVTSSLAHTMDDLGEVRGERTWSVRLVCRPYGRSQTAETGTVTLATVGTTRQRLGSIAVAGSVPTDLELAVEHASSALGETLLYTFPDDGSGHNPALRSRLTSAGTTTADAALVSGAWNMLDTQMVFDIPAETLPAGMYLLMARLRGSANETANIAWNVSTRIGATTLAGSVRDETLVPVDLRVATWDLFVLGAVSLPMTPTGDLSAADVRLTIEDDDTAGVDVDLDEVWLFNLSVGALTQVSCGEGAAASGGPSKRLFVEPPSTDYPKGRVLRGHAADKSDGFYPGSLMTSWGSHEAIGGSDTGVFVVTANASAATVGYTYFPRDHTHASQ